MPYKSIYPKLDLDHVNGTSIKNIDYFHYYAFDNSKSLTDHLAQLSDPPNTLIHTSERNSWISRNRERTKQRIWADLEGSDLEERPIKRLYYENYHNNGGSVYDGAHIGSIWGSNVRPEAYGTYSGLTKLWEGKFEIHELSNQSNAQYIYFVNDNSYRYYSIDIYNNYSGNAGIGFRRLEFQILE
jgi:hypothetical protein